MTDYMDKIDWTKAPEWAQWAAMDSDADVWWYQHEPDLAARSWYVGGGIDFQGNAPDASKWRESLRQRPSAKPEPAAPKLWRDMTPEEKGALLLARHEGKVIETDYGGGFIANRAPSWDDECAYRIRPEPKRETVRLSGYVDSDGDWLFEGPDVDFLGLDEIYRITFDVINGEPDCASVKMERIE
jgi:hypothetical protein